jgi:LPS-assembly protein
MGFGKRGILAVLGLVLGVSMGAPCDGKEIVSKKGPLSGPAADAETPVHIQADSITYDRQADQYVAEGNVEIVRAGMVLRADRAVLDNGTRVATADGRVQVFQEGSQLWSESLQLRLDDQTGRVVKGTLFFEPYNLTVYGDEIERLGEDRYRVRGATLSTCGGETPDWRFTAQEIDLTVGGEARASGATFQVRNVPVFYLPYLSYPARTDRRTGFLLPEYRSDSRVGYGVSLPFFWAIHRSYDATLTQTYFTKRGYQQGLEFRYAPWDWLRGSVEGEYLRDQEEPDSAVNYRGGPRETRDRWRIRMEHEARLPWGIVSRSDVDLVSDNYYLDDFSRDHDERYVRYLGSPVNATKRWDAFLLAGEARYFRSLTALNSENDRTPQRLPGLMFHKTQVPVLGLPVALGWDTGFESIWRPEGSTAQILSVAPVASVPLHLGPHVSLVPFGRWEERMFLAQGEPGGQSDGHLGVYHYGAVLGTELARVFPLGGDRLQSLKHTVQPELRFDAFGQSSSGAFLDEFMERVRHDRVVSAALTQFLTGKLLNPQGNMVFREYGWLRVIQPYSLREALDGSHGRSALLPLQAELELRLLSSQEGRRASEIRKGPWLEPHPYLNLKFTQAYDWDERELDNLSATLRGGDARGDEAALGYRWVRPALGNKNLRKQVEANVGVRTLPFLDLLGQVWYDHESDQWVRYGYGLMLHPDCWAVRFSHTIEPGYGGRETDHAFRVQIYLLGLDRVAKF